MSLPTNLPTDAEYWMERALKAENVVKALQTYLDAHEAADHVWGFREEREAAEAEAEAWEAVLAVMNSRQE
jgi:hypothetical protein